MTRYLTFLVFILSFSAYSQKVGLVLSGGGAKGLAHVGVLKALEEHDIPVNYIVGTSMGGIIGGCYAAGMSPENIEAMVLSEDFLRWLNGLPEKGYNYFYHDSDVNPGFLKLDLSLDSTFNFQFNSSIASDVSLNFALADKMAQASAISNNNFDSLFIPLRLVAADIFTQNEVVLSKGSLSDALRATQTVPFFYSPIRVEGKYLFDGGVYNNFPVDIAQREFNPEVIIGVNVSTKIFDKYPFESDEKLISKSLLFLLLDKSDPSMIPENGVFIQPDLKNFTSFDFSQAKAMIDSGYSQTIRQIEEIKAKVKERSACEDVMKLRNNFNNRNYPYVFNNLTFQGYNSKQRGYIRGIFKTRKHWDQLMDISDIKQGYFRMVSEEYFRNVYPRILFNREKKAFNLELTRRSQQNFQVDFGGVIATRDISNIYLGLNYYRFNRTLSHIVVGFQTGNFYKSAVARMRADFPLPVYIEPYIGVDAWNYLNNEDLLKDVSSIIYPTVLKRFNQKYGVNVGLPIKQSFKGVFSFEGFSNSDRYVNGDVFISTDTLDRLRLNGYKVGITLNSNTLNRKQYASSGRSYLLSAFYYNVHKTYNPGNTSLEDFSQRSEESWFRFKAALERYFGIGNYHPGFYVEGVLSNQPTFKNYFGTIINAPAFLPLQDSPTLILQNFRAFNYVAGGMRNVFTLRSRLDFRLEAYLFKPFEYLRLGANQEAVVSHELKSLFFTGTAGLVFHSPIGPVSLSVNYYDDKENKLGVLLHAGFLLFKNHSLE
jgi:NTE family protein